MSPYSRASIILSIAAHNSSHAFVPPAPFTPTHVAQRLSSSQSPIAVAASIQARHHNHNPMSVLLQMAATTEDVEKEISSMRVKEIRQELESYGIPTKSFFEKGEMVDALVKARLEGKSPIDTGANGDGNGATDTSSSGSNSAGSTSSGSSSTSTSGKDRTERIAKEMEKCKKMKVGELKKELESYGVSTKSYFEKSEFVRAVAEARVDGPPKKSSSSGSSSSSSSSSAREEPRDPSYRDVVVTKFTGNMAQLGRVLDVRAR